MNYSAGTSAQIKTIDKPLVTKDKTSGQNYKQINDIMVGGNLLFNLF